MIHLREPFDLIVGTTILPIPDRSAKVPNLMWESCCFGSMMGHAGYPEIERQQVERVAAWLRRPVPAESPADKRIELPDDQRGLSVAEIRRVDHLKLRIARTDIKPAKREAAKQELERIETSKREALEARWLSEATDETKALAEARGEAVETTKGGRTWIPSRNPILALSRLPSPALTAAQTEAGYACIAYYEARMESLGSQMGAINAIGGAHDNAKFVFNSLQRAKKLQRIAVIERAVALECRLEPTALQMLRGVCGEGKSVSHYGGGRVYERNLSALKMALDVADKILTGKA